ncbi:MAG: VRR-NUC domain-containing protein [Telluria sp.]
MRESKIEKYLVERVKALGGEVRKVNWIGRRGAPDRLVMLPTRRLTEGLDCAWCNPAGLVIWVELKATGKVAEPHQLREHKRMRAMGQRVEVVDSFQRVDEVLA